MSRREAIFKAMLRNSGSVALFDLAPSRLNGAGEGSNWRQQGQRQAEAQERVTLLRPATGQNPANDRIKRCAWRDAVMLTPSMKQAVD